MAVLTAAKGDLVLVDAGEEGLNGLYLVAAADVPGGTVDVAPVAAPATLLEAKDAVPDPDWPKTVKLAAVIAIYAADAIGF